ncbi:hypothetical protein [Alienimonas californiensis]|uniref:Uncharacterized protein n=1 Tax=Alienimonas californiensis TaxID=2527989 RepID=A0A517PFR5_9PLAN|nr:hypothetical protein [Alienimonas californiensis]QDT18220.1 hypothetical protein CA12_43610 [Alienimonas californiensis]
MFALAAALLVAPAFAPQPPGVEVIIEPHPPGGGFGFGGGGFGFGGRMAPAGSPTGETFLHGQGAGVLISPDGSQIWGWSAAVGDLVPLPVAVPEADRGNVQPVVGQGVVMFVTGGSVYAFGGASGEWGSHPIGERATATPIVGSHVAAIRTADGVYAYSGLTGSGGLHPLDADERIDGPAVGGNYVRVASERAFGLFSAKAGKWGSVRYERAEPQPTPEVPGQPGPGEPNDPEIDRSSSDPNADEPSVDPEA